jgi:hypothetical protein
VSRVHATVLAIVGLFLATQAHAEGCGDNPLPFQDVTQNDIFCTDAAWAKNANITLGCGDGTNFCPAEDVTRAQMVLFLRRTAEATFPVNRFAESSLLPPGDLDGTGLNGCTTAPISLPASANFSFAQLDAVVSMQGGASAADVEVSVITILDGMAFGPAHLVNSIATVPAGQWAHASVTTGFRPLPPGTSNSWRIHVARAPGSASTGELVALRCQVKAVSIQAPVPPI